MSRIAVVFLLHLALSLGTFRGQRRARYELESIYNVESNCNNGATKVQIDFHNQYLRSSTFQRPNNEMEVLQFTLTSREAGMGDILLFERQTIENRETFALCLQPGDSFWLTLYNYIPASIDKQARSTGSSAAVTEATLCHRHMLSFNERFEISPSVHDSCSSPLTNDRSSILSKETTLMTPGKITRNSAASSLRLQDFNEPSFSPSKVPSPYPTRKPTKPKPTAEPSDPPTSIPTSIPTSYPTAYPTPPPTSIPTSIPTSNPSPEPTSIPTATPTFGCNPSNKPTDQPSSQPSAAPTSPTSQPTSQPSQPSSVPTAGPSIPSITPTLAPSVTPSVSAAPTLSPSLIPTLVPSQQPSLAPSAMPSLSPSPTESPSMEPSAPPTMIPTLTPSRPTARPTIADIEEIPRPTVGAPGSGTPQDAGSKKAFVETDTGIGTLAGAGVVVLAIVAIVVFYCVRASRNVVKVPQAPPNLAMRI